MYNCMCLLVNWSGLWFGVVRHEHSPQCDCELNCNRVLWCLQFCLPLQSLQHTMHYVVCFHCINCCFLLIALRILHSMGLLIYTVCPSTPHCHSTWQTRWTEHCTVYMFAYVINCKSHWHKNCIQLLSTRILTQLSGRTHTLPGMHGHNGPTTCNTLPQMHTVNTKCQAHTQFSELIEVLPHMKNNCLFTLLEVGIGVKGLQVADQDIVTHFIVNLCRKNVHI